MKNWIFIISFILILAFAAVYNSAGYVPFLVPPQFTLEKKELELEDPLVIKFNHSFAHHKAESSFSLEPSAIGNIKWTDNTLIFIPLQPWQPGIEYRVSFSGQTTPINSFLFEEKFTTEDLPQAKSITPSSEELSDPKSPIKLSLTRGGQSYRLNFKIVPSINYQLVIDEERKNFEIIPEQPLNQDTRYQVVAMIGYQDNKDKLWYQKELANYIFKTKQAPKIEKVIPDTNDAEITEFEPFKAYFNKPMNTNDWQKYFEVNPQVNGSVAWEDEGKVLTFKPAEWAEDTEYNIKIKTGLSALDNTFLDHDYLASFKSKKKKYAVTQAAAGEARFKDGKYIDINLAKQILTIFQEGKNKGNYKISSGKSSMPTPRGSFEIINKKRRAWSNKYKLFMPYWMAFTNQGHGIHELPEWPNGYKEGAKHLGIPVSHGCVRLGVGAAESVYHWADIGTPVYIH